MPRPALAKVSLASLQAEIERRTAKFSSLIAQRDALSKEIEALQGLVGATPVRQGKKPGPKPGRKAKAQRATGRPLAQYIHEVLAATEKGLRLKDIEAKVLAAGYPTTAESIYKPIMKVLSKGFKRVARGVYAVEAAMKAGKKATQAALAPVARKPKQRGQFSETAVQFILGLAKGKGATTAQINKAWRQAGRGGSASPNLSVLFKAKKIKREPLQGEKGFFYTLA